MIVFRHYFLNFLKYFRLEYYQLEFQLDFICAVCTPDSKDSVAHIKVIKIKRIKEGPIDFVIAGDNKDKVENNVENYSDPIRSIYMICVNSIVHHDRSLKPPIK